MCGYNYRTNFDKKQCLTGVDKLMSKNKVDPVLRFIQCRGRKVIG